MFVRLKVGAYAGEIREMKFADGRVLVDSGRADQVDPSAPGPTDWIDARAPRFPRGPQQSLAPAPARMRKARRK